MRMPSFKEYLLETEGQESENKEILDKMAGKWNHYKKTKPILAKKLEEDQTVKTLEGPIQAKAGSWLCKGMEIGELWAQKEDKLFKTYKDSGKEKDGWKIMDPNPDAKGVWAAQVTGPFKVKATWGMLSGKSGDYIVKNFDDGEVDYPEDVWIVDQKLFNSTYEKA